MIEMICGDSMQIMEGMRQRMKPSFDMIFLDPPYFEWADKTPLPNHNTLSYLAYSLLKPNGCVFLCGTQPQMARDWRWWDRWFNLNFELIAYKHAGTPPTSRKKLLLIHENIWCLYSKKDSFDDLKIDTRRVSKAGRVVKVEDKADRMQTRYGEDWMEWRTDVGYPKSVQFVFRIDQHSKEYEGHPAQKPLNLTKLIVKMSTDEGDWVLDPFAGVGTTLVACQQLERNCLGIEINPEYIRLTRRRLARIQAFEKLEGYINDSKLTPPASV